MSKRKWTDEQLIEAVKNNVSIASVARCLNLKPSGSNYDTIHTKIKLLKLNTSHFTGKGWNVGKKYRSIKKKTELAKVLVQNSEWVNTFHLKKRLLKENIKEYRCECCKRSEWMGKPIPLELHHVNGIKNDLRLKNLQLLCPNCHSFTDNYRGRGMSAQKEISEVEAS